MKPLLALLLALFAAPALSADWTRTIAVTPEGGYRIGNPRAAVKVIEYFSLTCPHCRAFVQNDLPTLKTNYVAKGRVSLELRNFFLNGPDLAASILMRCARPVQAVRLYDAVFADQEALFFKQQPLAPEAIDRIRNAPDEKRALQFAQESGITRWFAARGVSAPLAATCLTDKKGEEKLLAMRKQAVELYDVQGTPSFVVNGRKIDGGSWAELEPAIQKALKTPAK